MAGEFGWQRWSGAVREMFLRELAAHGRVRRAGRAVGMSPSAAYYWRRRDPDFARLWDVAVARVRAERAARIAAAARKLERGDGLFRDYHPRSDGWTERRTRIFLRALSETGCVRDACKRAGISDGSAYRMRRRDAKFAAAWQKALAVAAPTLEQAAWERAVEGWDEVVWKDGVEVSRKRRYSDALLKFLLSRMPGQAPAGASPDELIDLAHAAARAAGGIFSTRATEEETNAAILKKLAMMDKVRAQEAADAAAAARAAGGGDREDADRGEEAKPVSAAEATRALPGGAAAAPGAAPSVRRLT